MDEKLNVIANTSKYVSYGAGTGATILGSISWDELATIIGIITALLTFLVSCYFQWRKDRRDEEMFQLNKHHLEEEWQINEWHSPP